MDKTVVVGCRDLGMAAYLKMRGYELVARRGREFDFSVKESEKDDFNKYKIEYVNSSCAEFDSEIMNLKKLDPNSEMVTVKTNGMVITNCRDLGMAAYLKMRGYELLARRGKEFYFSVKESEQSEFEQIKVEYVNSSYAEFDSEIMNLKKI